MGKDLPREKADSRSDGPFSAPPQVFFVMQEVPCPYLANRFERKLITELQGPGAKRVYDALSQAGFRRSHHFAYRPACQDCQACVPVRIDARNFQPSRNLRRITNINADLTVHEQRSVATQEQYAVFARYLASRHGDGEMADMDFDNYQAMVDDTALQTSLIEFRDPDRKLVAACLTDWLADGPSAVYSFFDPEHGRRSLGSYMILWLIEAARARSLPYVYLGYWVEGAEKMDYKRRFRPLQGLLGGKWREIA